MKSLLLRKINQFDIIRVVAMFAVVIDHYFQLTGNYYLNNTGLCLGAIAVAQFFTLSALLFGDKWRKSENRGFKLLPFLQKRFMKIYIPLWVALVFIIALELYAHNPIDVKIVVFNFLGLSWIMPFVWGGHLWYITMIIILYVEFLVLSYIRTDKIPLSLWFITFVGLSITILCLPNVFNTVSKAIVPYAIFFAAMFFAVGDKLLALCGKYKILIFLCAIVCSGGTLSLYCDGVFQSLKGVATVLSFISGVLLFLALATVFKNMRCKSKIIGLLSGISYEVYLIHMTAIMFVKVLLPDCCSILFYCLSIVLILISALLLHILCVRINNSLIGKV